MTGAATADRPEVPTRARPLVLVLPLLLALALAGAAPARAQAPWGADDPPALVPWWGQADEPPATDEPAGADDAPASEEGPASGDEPVPAPAQDDVPSPAPVPDDEPALPETAWDDPAPVPPAARAPALPPLVTGTQVPGTRARLRTDGRAAVPRGAPKRVRRLIAAFNQIVGKPYVWGGGHARLVDRGYDCSGAVSYGLIRTGMLRSPLVSGALARWAAAGAGRWVTVYANAGHVYLEIAGLRLDTSPVADPRGGRGPRWRPAIGRRPGFRARHPVGL